MDTLNKDCRKCPDLVESRRQTTWGYGNPESNLFFVGEAPGRFGCDITGIPFTKDKSGEFFQEMLGEVGLTKEDVYVTNLVKCCPEKNRDPSNLEVANCLPYIRYELAQVKPEIVVLLGRYPLKAFLNIDKIIANWDKSFTGLSGQRYIVLPHPAYICRNMNSKPQYIKSFQRLKELVHV